MFFLRELPTRTMLDRYAARFPQMDVGKTEQALHMMRRASLLIRDLEACFREHGVSMTRFLILIVLDREPGMAFFTLSDLVHRLDVSRPVISNTVKALQKERLVSVTPSRKDSRSRQITITVSGRRKLDELLPGYYEVINRHMQIPLSPG